MTTQEFIYTYRPCFASRQFITAQPDLATAWEKCELGDWLIWCARNLRILDKHSSVKIACACARRVLKHVQESEERPLKAIEAAEKWLADQSEENRMAAAAAAADAAAYAAAAAADAAAYAAAAAADADAAAYAAAAAADAAAAAYAAAAAADADAAAYAAYAAADAIKEERKAKSDIIRSIIPNPFKQ